MAEVGSMVTRNCTATIAAFLAEHGYVVVNFNYRLSPQNKYPAAIEDVAYLIRYIHENAQTLGIDMDNLYMVGDSAGHSSRQIIAS